MPPIRLAAESRTRSQNTSPQAGRPAHIDLNDTRALTAISLLNLLELVKLDLNAPFKQLI